MSRAPEQEGERGCGEAEGQDRVGMFLASEWLWLALGIGAELESWPRPVQCCPLLQRWPIAGS